MVGILTSMAMVMRAPDLGRRRSVPATRGRGRRRVQRRIAAVHRPTRRRSMSPGRSVRGPQATSTGSSVTAPSTMRNERNSVSSSVAGGDQHVVRVRLGGVGDVGARRVGLGGGVRVVDDHRLLVVGVHLACTAQQVGGVELVERGRAGGVEHRDEALGRSLPSGPATTPQASSGWSRRAWATISSWIARSMRSTGPDATDGRRRRGGRQRMRCGDDARPARPVSQW